MFLKCYSSDWSVLTRKQHSDYAVSSILDKLRVMTRDGSGSEGEYLWLGLSAVWAWEWLRPQRCSAFFPVDCLFGGENQSYCCCRAVEASNHSLFLVGQISFISQNSNVRLAIAGSRIIWKSEPTPTVGILGRREESNSVIPGFRIN